MQEWWEASSQRQKDLPTSYALCGGITTSRYRMEFVWQPAQFSVQLITSLAGSAPVGEKGYRNIVFFKALTYLLIRKPVVLSNCIMKTLFRCPKVTFKGLHTHKITNNQHYLLNEIQIQRYVTCEQFLTDYFCHIWKLVCFQENLRLFLFTAELIADEFRWLLLSGITFYAWCWHG